MPADFLIIGSPGDRRVELFQSALTSLELPPARLVSYLDLLAGRVSLADMVTPATIVRIEFPGKQQEVERALLALGAEVPDPEGDQYERLSRYANALCRQRVHVELWIPKASYGRQVFDLRVLVVAGQARHTVVRMSNSPMTNLHLLNKRGDTEAVLAAIGTEHWDEARQTCERASQLFRSLHTGVDLLFSSSFRYHALVEMNAFGDLLPGVLHNGQDTYMTEILAALNQRDR